MGEKVRKKKVLGRKEEEKENNLMVPYAVGDLINRNVDGLWFEAHILEVHEGDQEEDCNYRSECASAGAGEKIIVIPHKASRKSKRKDIEDIKNLQEFDRVLLRPLFKAEGGLFFYMDRTF